jgi:hypothetical protein
MKRFAVKNRILLLFIACFISVSAFSQDITGIWKGYFISDDGQHYRLEFQVKQNANGTFAASGVSYSWQDDIRFYGKATMTGNFLRASKNLRIREIKTVELKNPGGITCIMNYNLTYSRSGKEEFLEGTYLGKQEVRGRPNPYEWGSCGGGTVYLRRVVTSDFYVEPFLRNNARTKTPRTITPKKETEKTNTTVAKKQPPAITKPKVPEKTVARTTPKPVTKKNEPAGKPVIDSAKRADIPVVKNITKPVVNVPAVLKERQNELMKSLIVHDPDVTVKLYDNGEIDDDTISVYLDKKLILSQKRLTASPLIIKLRMDEDDPDHELVMVAENLGRIPPNTSLMSVTAGDERFDVRITSTEQKNAVVRFKYQKPK